MQLKFKRLFFKKTVISSLIFFCIFVALTVFVSPENRLLIIPFFLSFAGFLFFGLASFLNPRRALLITGGFIFYLLLRYFELRHFLYPILIIAICIALELYFRPKAPKRRHV